MKFTKKQRHEIYKEALVVLRSDKQWCLRYDFGESDGLCAYFRQAIRLLHRKRMNNESIFNLLPEFAFKQPKSKIQHEFWWDSTNWSIRVRVLNKCIKETA